MTNASPVLPAHILTRQKKFAPSAQSDFTTQIPPRERAFSAQQSRIWRESPRALEQHPVLSARKNVQLEIITTK